MSSLAKVDISPASVAEKIKGLRLDDMSETADLLEALALDRDKWSKLDREASTNVESVICMRTDFSGDPPYVGWKGLGLALNEALDKRDAALAQVASLGEALTPSAETKADYIGEFKFTLGDWGPATFTVPWTTIKEIMAAILSRAEKNNAELRRVITAERGNLRE